MVKPLTALSQSVVLGLMLASVPVLAAPTIQTTTIQQAEPLKAPAVPTYQMSSVIVPLATSTATGWSINTANRQLVRGFFSSVYSSSIGTPITWTGSVSPCVAGTTSETFKKAVLTRINYYRAMVGVPATVTFDPTNNAKAQQAALMMSANNALSHTPPTTWNCYTLDGATAAGNSNISLGHNGWDAVDGQIRDNGTSNTAAGHRRWLLLPQAQVMGTGDVAASGTYRPANAIWVPLSAGTAIRPTTRDTFVAWPTKGYNPYNLVPIRWSFAYPNGNFANATVTMTQAGIAVPVTIDSRVTGYGENTIVWRPNNLVADNAVAWPKPTTDTSYQVTVSNVIINGVATTFTYTVTVFDPTVAAVGEQSPTITGSAQPIAGASTTYTISLMSWSPNYDAFIAQVAANADIFTAETTSPAVSSSISSTYTLSSTGAGTNGTTVYRLAPASVSETFTLPSTYVPSATSSLVFDSKLGYATTQQVAAIQISTDNGTSWKDLYTKAGTGSGSPEESAFSTKTISLSAYANKLIRLRAEYRRGTSFYVGTDNIVSFLVDNLKITNAKKVTSSTTQTNLTTSFAFTPVIGKSYLLAARAVPWAGYPGLAWGNLVSVTPIALGTPTPVTPAGNITTRTPKYTWQAVTGATHYTLYVSDVTGQGKIQATYTNTQANCATGTTCYFTPTVAVSGNASWKVQAKAGTVVGAWSALKTFTAPPAVTTFISPKTTSTTKTPTYSWTAVPGATQYLLWVDNGGVLGKIQTIYTSTQANCATGTTCSVTPTTAVSGSATWKVQSQNAAGNVGWSTSATFTAPN